MAQAQPAQVEAIPEMQDFDMFDLDSVEDPAIALPDVDALTGRDSVSVEIGVEQPPGTDPLGPSQSADTSDPCRHFTLDERRRLPALCGSSD